MTYNKLFVSHITPEQHAQTCNYWYLVHNAGSSHTAFTTLRGLQRWMEERGLQLGGDGELGEAHGLYKGMPIIGEYAEQMHMSYDDFYALPAFIETKVLSNGEYTHARITAADGMRTVHTMNPNCKFRTVYPYRESSEEMK